MCDAHVHVTAVTADLAALQSHSEAYVAARAGAILGGMLARGFTTVRDAGARARVYACVCVHVCVCVCVSETKARPVNRPTYQLLIVSCVLVATGKVDGGIQRHRFTAVHTSHTCTRA